MKIPKLIVQPFVENAIVHGLDQVDGVCEVTVSAIQEGNFVRFEITDTGIGMTQEQLDGLWKTETAQYANHRIGRYAIRNIRERLQLRYQDRFRLDIRSAVGKGTTVAFSRYTDKIELTAFQTGESIVVVFLNRTDEALPAYLRVHDQCVPITLAPRSISTGLITD